MLVWRQLSEPEFRHVPTMTRLTLRTVPVFAGIIGFAIALAVYMNFSGVRTAYLDLIRARMAMTAGAVASDVTAAASLGIPLAEQTTLADLLARLAKSDPLTLSIDVAADDGRVAFSSDPGRVGAPGAAEYPIAFSHREDVMNDFGAPLGAVVVRLDRAAIDGAIARFRGDILGGAVPLGLAAVLAGCLLCLLMLTRLHRRARRAWSDGTIDGSIARVAGEVDRIEAKPVA